MAQFCNSEKNCIIGSEFFVGAKCNQSISFLPASGSLYLPNASDDGIGAPSRFLYCGQCYDWYKSAFI